MKLPTTVRFADEKLQDSFYKFKNGTNEEKQLFDQINKAMDELEIDAFCGIQISKKLIPKEYEKYDITNLWKYNLPNGWRLIYSIQNNHIIIISLILEWMNHKEYERRFQY